MAQLFDPIPADAAGHSLCCYVNATSKMQVVRITNIPGWYFERVVFPGQRLVFEALPQAQLEVHCGMMASAILADTIPCDRLQIASELAADFEIEIVAEAKGAEAKGAEAKEAEAREPVITTAD